MQKLFGVMKDLGNPFQEESKDLLTLDAKNIAHPSAAELVRTHFEKGQVAFRDFFNGLGNEDSFYRPIKKNKVDFFRQDRRLSLQRSWNLPFLLLTINQNVMQLS